MSGNRVKEGIHIKTASTDFLLESYKKAQEVHADQAFILLLEKELIERLGLREFLKLRKNMDS